MPLRMDGMVSRCDHLGDMPGAWIGFIAPRDGVSSREKSIDLRLYLR